MRDTLDLINRQKAKIARLQKTQGDIDNFARELCNERTLKGKAIADFEDLQEYIRKEKSEAIREFADKSDDLLWNMKIEYNKSSQIDYGLVCEVIHHKLMKILKDTVGSNNE